MYKLYNVNNKIKSDIKGLWRDDNNKVYFDNIQIITCYTKYKLLQLIRKSFLSGEKACFYTSGGIAYIMNNDKSIIELLGQKRICRDKLSIKEVKALLKQYSGLTIFKNRIHDNYIIDIRY